jgi:restriction endonuclease S subunit
MRDGWIETTLGNIAEISSGSRAKGGAISSGIPSIGGEQISEDRSIKFYKMKYIPIAHYKQMNSGKLELGDSLIVKDGATTGKIGYWKYDLQAAVNEHVFIIRAKKNQITSFYLNMLICQNNFQSEISQRTKGIIGGINRDIENIKVKLPPLTEQKRIVDLISSVDSYIEALQQQVDKAKKSRNAVLHEFLARDWEGSVETTLGEVATWGSGGTPKADNSKFYGGNIPWCVIGDLNEGDVFDTEKKITDLGLKNSSAKKIEPGHVLIAMYGASIGKTGIAAIEMATNQAIAFAKVHENLLTNKYLLIYLQSQKNKFVEAGQGAAQPNISQTVLKSWRFSLPPIDVQHGLVKVISSFDNQIQGLEKTNSKTKDLRSALLSELLSGNHEIPTTYDRLIGAA